MELWIADTELHGLDRQLEQMLALLPTRERERAFRFRKRGDRLRFAAGRLMIRALAAKSSGRADVPLLVTEYGKPFFASAGAPQFSLSHAGRLVVLAVGDAPLGVDVEERSAVDWRELAFALGEKERMLLEESGDPMRLFYRIWTVREAFSKEEGVGLPIFESGGALIDYAGETIRYQGRTLRCRTWEQPGYTLSICAEQLGDIRLCRLSAPEWNSVLGTAEGGAIV